MADFERETGVAVKSAEAVVIISSPGIAAPRQVAAAEAVVFNVRGRAGFEVDATRALLQPGEALYAPPGVASRGLPGEDFNVSVLVDFVRRHAWPQAVLHRAQALVRHPAAPKPVAAPLAPRFDVDLAAADCLRWRPGQRPDWAAPPPGKPRRKAA
jgi:hypothetical protein